MVMLHHLGLGLGLGLGLDSRDGLAGMEGSVQDRDHDREQIEWIAMQADQRCSGLHLSEYNRTKDRWAIDRCPEDQAQAQAQHPVQTATTTATTTAFQDRWAVVAAASAAQHTVTANSRPKKRKKKTWRRQSKRSAS